MTISSSSAIELGVPGAFTPTEDLPGAASTVGGRACFPTDELPAGIQDLSCTACQSRLSLLLQVVPVALLSYSLLSACVQASLKPKTYLQVQAPLQPGSLRTVCLFACPDHRCQGGQSSFKAVSYQPFPACGTQQPQQGASTEPKHDQLKAVHPPPDTWSTATDWGASEAWGDEASEQTPADTFDMSDLQDQLTSIAAANQGQTGGTRSAAPFQRSVPAQDVALTGVSWLETPRCFPHFYLCFEAEPQQGPSDRDSEHIQKLMGQYQAHETAEVRSLFWLLCSLSMHYVCLGPCT